VFLLLNVTFFLTDTREFQCDQCSKTFKNKSGLMAHLDIHKGKVV